MIRHRCKAKTNKGQQCKRNTRFLYCKQHWSKSKIIIWTAVGVIGTIAGLYQDFIKPAYDKIFPSAHWECSQDQNIRGILLNKAYTKKRNELYLLLGLKGRQSWKISSRSEVFWSKDPSCALPAGIWGYECAIKYRVNKRRKLFISADLFDADHCLVGKVSDNRFILNHNCEFTWNFDKNGFEVVDLEFNVVFSLHYYPPSAIAIQGVFHSGGELVLINDNGMKFLPKDNPKEIHEARKTIKPIFEYFGKDWFGKRNPNSSVIKIGYFIPGESMLNLPKIRLVK